MLNKLSGKGWTNVAGTEGETTIEAVNEAQEVAETLKKIYFSSHEHNFTYTANGATITATCTADGCSLPPTTEGGSDHVAKLSLVAPTLTTYGGTGDAAAALVGIPFGKHKARLPFADGKKSWEGSGAMFLVSFLVGSFILIFLQEMPPLGALVRAGTGAFVGAAAELFSPSELDTVTVPSAIALVLLLLC